MGTTRLVPGQPDPKMDPNFRSGSFPALVTFAFESIGPPTSLYIQRDDRIHVKLMNSVANTGFTVRARLLMPIGPLPGQPDQGAQLTNIQAPQKRGWVQIIEQLFFPTSDRTPNEFDVVLSEGYLLDVNLSVGPFPSGLQRGQAYASVGLHRGGGAGVRFQTLFAGLPAANVDIGWPGGPMQGSGEGPGVSLSITVANPAAGADWSLTVPATTRWRLVGWSALLTTSAAVASRLVRFRLSDAGAIAMSQSTPNQAVPAGTAAQVTGITSTTAAVAGEAGVLINVPGQAYMTAGMLLLVNTLNLQAADQWSNIRVQVEEWIGT